MSLHFSNESALNLTGVIIIVVVAAISLTAMAGESGWASLPTSVTALLLLA
jgi:hypothetical protein